MDFRVLLLGGIGDGFAVTLQRLAAEIQVLLQDGVLVVAEEDDISEASTVEIYHLVGPVGPEMPVYVRA